MGITLGPRTLVFDVSDLKGRDGGRGGRVVPSLLGVWEGWRGVRDGGVDRVGDSDDGGWNGG